LEHTIAKRTPLASVSKLHPKMILRIEAATLFRPCVGKWSTVSRLTRFGPLSRKATGPSRRRII
jgi:hypothetical protein